LIHSLAKSEGYECRSFTLKTEAYDWIVTYRTDMIISDILRPPFMDGFQLIDWLKVNSRTTTIPCLFLSAFSDIHIIGRAMQRGAAGYITTGRLEAENLIQTIDRILQESETISSNPFQLSREQMIRINELKFLPWIMLTNWLAIAISKVFSGGVMFDSPFVWHSMFYFIHDGKLCDGLLLRPVGYNHVTVDHVYNFAAELHRNHFGFGVLLSFFNVEPTVINMARRFGIAIIPPRLTNRLLCTAFRNDQRPPTQEELVEPKLDKHLIDGGFTNFFHQRRIRTALLDHL